MGIIAFIILGLLAGGAKALMPGDDPGGWIVTTIIGVAGALLGGFLAGALFRQIRWTSSLTSRAGSGNRRLDRLARHLSPRR